MTIPLDQIPREENTLYLVHVRKNYWKHPNPGYYEIMSGEDIHMSCYVHGDDCYTVIKELRDEEECDPIALTWALRKFS